MKTIVKNMIKQDYKLYIWNNGDIKYLYKQNYHRLDGPANETYHGVFYWVDGKLHRTNGPAIAWSNGEQSYWINDKLHRLDGPAVTWDNGEEFYFVDNKEVSKEDFYKNYYQKNDYTRIYIKN